MLVLTGSLALQHRHPYMLGREPRDLDAIGTFDEVNRLLGDNRKRFRSILPSQGAKKMVALGADIPCEFEIAWDYSSAQSFLQLVQYDPDTIIGRYGFLGSFLVPSIHALYALKLSHRYLKDSPAFDKTMRDIRVLREAGAEVPARFWDWFKLREKETYNYSHPNLSQDKKNFFSGDGIRYVYDHDSIHLSMAVHERPAYTYFKKDGAEVAVDRQKWEDLPFEYQIASVLEETYVLALERSQVPFPGRLTPEHSFKKALEKVCTSITSGWWREFAWENYEEAVKRYDSTYTDRFWKAVETGVVRRLPEG